MSYVERTYPPRTKGDARGILNATLDVAPITEVSKGKPTLLLILGKTNPIRQGHDITRFTKFADDQDMNLKTSNAAALDDRSPWTEPDKLLEGVDMVIFGGSGDVDLTVPTPTRNRYVENVTPVILELMGRATGDIEKEKIPTLGICLGAQVFHMVQGGRMVRNNERAEMGTGILTLKANAQEHPYLTGMPTHQPVTLMHQDSIEELGTGLETIFGSTERDPYSITGTDDGTILLVTFHPEVDNAKFIDAAIEAANVGRSGDMTPYVPNYPLADTPDAEKFLTQFFTTASTMKKKMN